MKQVLFLACVILLSACLRGTVETSGDSGVDGQNGSSDFLNRLESLPIDLTDTTHWSRLSFSTFAMHLPRNWRVIEFSDSQDKIGLANSELTDVEARFDENVDHGLLQLNISIEAERKIAGLDVNGPSEQLKVDNNLALKVDSEESGFSVYVQVPSQQKLYKFDFGHDFGNFEDFAGVILSTVSFHQRQNLSQAL